MHWVLDHLTSQVSSSGRYIAFMSDRSLTGYENLDANSGELDEEVFLYDESSSDLVRASWKSKRCTTSRGI